MSAVVKVHVDRLATCDKGVCAAFIPQTTNMLLRSLSPRPKAVQTIHFGFYVLDVRMSIAFSVSLRAVYGCY